MPGLAIAATLALAALAAGASGGERAVAVTIDDLPAPGGGIVSNMIEPLRANTQKLLAALSEAGVPAIGFVNEGKLEVDGETEDGVSARTAILKLWVDAGYELGNHTRSHRSLNDAPLGEFEADVVGGEPVTRVLLNDKGLTLRYFRHPFLHVGLELSKRRAFETFLAERGYTIAPVTIDSDDYVFAAIYAAALRKKDEALAARVADAYLGHMDATFAFAEDQARALTGREIRHVLLLHANSLNADRFGPLAARIKDRGYRFVTLQDALADEVYARPDSYVGRWGLTWLYRWELTEGRQRSPAPDPPEWVMKAYQALGR